MSAATEPLSPTTGESVAVIERRNRMGMWLIIVSCSTGTVALLVAYSYLWSLNVNSAWAPPAGTANWAPVWPFWVIFTGMFVATLLLWRGQKLIGEGNSRALVRDSALSSLILLVCFVAQIVQIATFPFGPQDGAYASSTLWLALANGIWLFLALFLTAAVMNRTRAGRITPESRGHARLVAMFLTYLCVAAFLGSVFTTVMQDSPNTGSPVFGTFKE